MRKEKRGTQEVVIMQLVHYGKTCVPAGKYENIDCFEFLVIKNILLCMTQKVCFSYHCRKISVCNTSVKVHDVHRSLI